MIKMRKLFLKISMLLFVLGMSTNAAWAGGNIQEMLSKLPKETQQQIIDTYTAQTYCARLTGHASSTGGGKVYVVNSESEDPRDGDYVEGTSNVSVNGMGMAMEGMTKIGIAAWAKPDDGYYLAGWSYSNMGTDLGTASDPNQPNVYFAQYDIAIKEHETIDHVIYGTFEPIRIADYAVSGSNEIDNLTCSQTVTFSLVGTDIEDDDFKPLSISSPSWVPTALTMLDANTASVTVTFTAPSADVAEYSANLVLETKAGVKINVPLYARAAISGVEAVRYDKNGDEKGRGKLDVMLAAANSTDVVKLCEDYNSPLTIVKSVTLDLNGHNLQVLAGTAITVDGGATLTLAFSPYGGQIQGFQQQGILVKYGSKAILKGGTIVNDYIGVKVEANAELELNGATIAGNTTAAIDNAGKVTTFDGVVIGLVKTSGTFEANGGSFRNVDENLANMDHAGGHAIQVEGGTAQLNKGDFTGKTYGVYSIGSANVSIEKLAVIEGTPALHAEGSSQITVNCGKFVDPALLFANPDNPDAGIEMVSMFFKENTYGITSIGDKKVWRNTAGAEYRDGYKFFGGTAEDAQMAGVSVCHIGGNSYAALEDALDYANGTSEKVVIIMDNDYTLPAGFYTLPANATLLIPNSNEQGAPNAIVPREESLDAPTLFRKLTLANGVNINVYGTIEVSGAQYSGDDDHTGAVTGDYAQLQMNQGSKMVLQNNAVLRAWGYVTGDIEHKNTTTHEVPMGEIDVRRGATVFELFQMGDWGQTVVNGLGLVSGDSRFPITSYFIQNVEVPAKYHPGGRLTSATTVSASGVGLSLTMCANDIQIIGVTGVAPAMFLMNQEADAENTWVRKWYDASKDQQVYEINSGAHIGNLVINLASSPLFESLENTLARMDGIMGTIGNLAQNMGAEFHQDLVMNSGQYVLPITSNFKLHLLSGTLDFTQSTELIPGSELVIDKEATVYVTDQNDSTVLEGSLYVYDYNEWNSSPARVNYTPSFDDGVNYGSVPSEVRDVSSIEVLGHAKVNVRGTFDTRDGYIFTSEHGGNIFSSVEDAGTFIFTSKALDADSLQAVNRKSTFDLTEGITGDTIYFRPAWLRNSDEWVASNGGDELFRYAKTGGTAHDRSYCYLDFDGKGGRWTLLDQRGCFTYDEADGSYYIKPQEYVKVLVTSVESELVDDDIYMWTIQGNDDHTFIDAAGTGRLFILLNDESFNCHWWEVEKEGNYYHCIHPENDTYYEWNSDNEEWQEVKFTITWKDKNWTVDETEDKILATYTVPYGTQAEWLSTNPTRPASVDYTYDFTGWTPALDKVKSDVTYTATYQEKQIKYTVVFVNDGGVEIERKQWARNEYPECENMPTRPGYTLEWTPAVAAVTKDTTYTATWKLIPPTEYEITFFDYDGKEKLQKGNVAVGALPTPPADPTGKPATSEYTYVFDHWSPEIEEVSATSPKSYTAVYREQKKTFPVNFYWERNAEQIGDTQYVEVGQMPIIPDDSRLADTEDADNLYKLVWNQPIQTVQGQAEGYVYEYIASYKTTPKHYSLTVKCTPAGSAEIIGARADCLNGESYEILVYPNSSDYMFSRWSDDAQFGWDEEKGAYKRTITIAGANVELTAEFEYKGDQSVTIIWMNGKKEIGSTVYEENSPTAYNGETPESSQSSAEFAYIFDGWTVASNGSGTVYKNGSTPIATQNATYYAHFKEEVKKYTIVWKNEDGTADLELDLNQPYGTDIAYNGVTPTKTADAEYTYTFAGWYNADTIELINDFTDVTVEGDATYYARFAGTKQEYLITWKRDDGSLIDQAIMPYGSIPDHEEPVKAATAEGEYEFTNWDKDFVEVTGSATYTAYFELTSFGNIELSASSSVDLKNNSITKHNLIITSNGDSSSDLKGGENLTLNGEAIFRMEKNFAAETWYAVAVPWTVALSGIRDKNGNNFAANSVYVLEFDAEAYASADRESGRNDYWHFLDDSGNDMQPGKLYMIWFRDAQTAVDFHKTSGSLWNTATEVGITGGDGSQANWNGIANPALYHANLATGADSDDVLKYNGNDNYVLGSTSSMIVGEPIFVQVGTPQPVVAIMAGGASSAPAYRHAPQAATETDNRFVLELTQFGKLNDRMIVQTAEEKADTYVIGKDLAKMGLSALNAQMWINRYDTKLCKNTVALQGESVEYPLNISAPVSGEYVLSASQERGEAALYLTYNGEAIWNLSESDYVLQLEKGTAANYGLRISVKNAPQVTTGMDEALVDAQGETRKVLIDNKVFIIRGDKVYTIDGQLVK